MTGCVRNFDVPAQVDFDTGKSSMYLWDRDRQVGMLFSAVALRLACVERDLRDFYTSISAFSLILRLDIREETEYSPDANSYGSLHRIRLWPCLRNNFIRSCN